MKPLAAEAPKELLLDPELTAAAKVLWLALSLSKPNGPVTPAQLPFRCPLPRSTFYHALDLLRRTGWYAAAVHQKRAGSDRTTATIPADLLGDPRVGFVGRLLYGGLQLTPGFHSNRGQFTVNSIGAFLGVSPNPLRQAVRELVNAGWIQVRQINRRRPVEFLLSNPIVARSEGAVLRARQRIEEAPYRGEALMREYLSLLVNSDEYEDDAAPGFLVNPFSDERLQFDRFYPPAVAFEFNGPQHYGPTARFTRKDSARQQGRDYIKVGICVLRGIKLVVIHPEDLTLARMREKICGLLPVRDLSGHQPLLTFLESASRPYRSALRRLVASSP